MTPSHRSTMNNVANLVNLLEQFDFNSIDTASTADTIEAVLVFLQKAEAHLQIRKANSPTQVQPIKSRAEIGSVSPSSTEPPSAVAELRENFLGAPLYEELEEHLKSLKYTPMSASAKSPSIALFGDIPYVFNKVTKNISPTPITSSSTLLKVLDTVNSKLGVAYNSILINKYASREVQLGWHQDNETAIDQSVSIATLSVGAARRIQFSDNKSNDENTTEKLLLKNSVLTMKPGIQSSHFHRIMMGRKKVEHEKGTRFSLTFRRLHGVETPDVSLAPHTEPSTLPTRPLSSPPLGQVSIQDDSSSDSRAPQPPHDTQPPPAAHSNCANCAVFGSSLTKGLKSDLLSRRGKTFKVFTKGGARVDTVRKMVKEAVEKKEVCTSCVQSIFLVVGGNDAANARSVEDLEGIKTSFTELVDTINSLFPAIRINILSLIPRRYRGYDHHLRVLNMNEYLQNLCSKDSCNLYFIPMFTKFLVNKQLYHLRKDVILNLKLFHRDRVHFNQVGNSVLAKTLIAVANDPRY